MNKWQKKEEKWRLKQLDRDLKRRDATHKRKYFGANKVTDVQKNALMYQSGGKCSKCGSSFDLCIVRKVPVKDGGSPWSISNMKVVCRNCQVIYDPNNPRLNW